MNIPENPILENPVLENPVLENPVKTKVATKRSKPKVAQDTKRKETPYSSIINTTQLVHKEVTMPTHIETKIEYIDTDGFNIEYIKLTQFEHNGSIYFKDNKNKLYKKIKDKIGQYIGRFNPEINSIDTDIPDSDDEN